MNLDLFYGRTSVTENSQLNFMNDYTVSKAMPRKRKLEEFARSDHGDGNYHENGDSSHTTIGHGEMPVTKKSRSGRPASEPKGPFRSKGAQRSKGPQNLKKPVAFNSLKTQIRDLKRLLEHGDDRMPADIRIIRERELAACEHELAQKQAESQAAARRKKMISKYHQVRFFGEQSTEP